MGEKFTDCPGLYILGSQPLPLCGAPCTARWRVSLESEVRLKQDTVASRFHPCLLPPVPHNPLQQSQLHPQRVPEEHTEGVCICGGRGRGSP